MDYRELIISLRRENELLRQEIRVSREAAEITASLVVKQFEETEEILRRFQTANALRRAVLNSAAQISIIATDKKGIIRVFNTGAENLLGYRAEEVIGKETPELFLLESVMSSQGDPFSFEGFKIKGLIDILFEYALEDSSEQLEWIYVRKDGTRFPVEMTINALRESDGMMSGILCIANDISERKRTEAVLKKTNDELERRVQQRTAELAKANRELQIEIREREQAEEALRDSEEKYRSIFENAAEGIFQTTPDGSLITANPAMARLLSYDSSEDIVKSISDLKNQLYVNPERRDELSKYIETEGVIKDFEAEFYRKDGGIIHVCMTAHVVRDEQGNALYYEGMLEDITQRKRSEELKIAKEAAEAATRAKSEFLANMSHEIRTPMNAIIGLTELMLKTTLNSQQQDYLRKIYISSHSLLGIINDVLDFSKIEAGRLELEYVNFKLDKVLDDLSDMFSGRIAEKGIEMVISIEDNVPYILTGDSLRLSQILINLTNNALKFTDKGEIVIKVSLLNRDTEKAELRFSVSDTGIGISKEYLPNLFTSFTQADTSTTRKYGGTGLGLTISSQLVKMMGGEIWAESEQGKGTTIFFTARFGVSDRIEKGERLPPAYLQGLRILIVDNNETSREVYTDILKSFTYKVSSACSGEDAIQELVKEVSGKHPYDMVLTDWRMPGMDGVETLKRIREIPELKDIPVIMMTAFGREEVMQRAEAAGVNAFLIKPVKQSLLFDIIANIFNKNGENVLNDALIPNTRIKLSKDMLCIKGSRILLAEDNPINQQVAVEIMKDAGIIVKTANNGKEAIQEIKKSNYDAVLMDIQMPEMDGYEASREIRNYELKINEDNQLKSRLPIIAMTAHAMKGDREKCIEAGMDDYVTKPINTKQLFSVLAKWIDSEQLSVNSEQLSVNSEQFKSDDDCLLTANCSLFTVHCIDVEAGLKRIKNKKVFKKLLVEFAERYEDASASVRESISKGNIKYALAKVHAIKGVSGNLSAEKLHEASRNLESALHNKDNVESRLHDFTSALDELVDFSQKLKNKGETQENDKEIFENAVSVDIEKIIPIINDLCIYLKKNDMEAEEYFKALKPYFKGSNFYQEIKAIESHIESLDFHKALEKLIQLTDNLGISFGGSLDEQ